MDLLSKSQASASKSKQVLAGSKPRKSRYLTTEDVLTDVAGRGMDSAEWQSAWKDWADYRERIGKRFTPRGLTICANKALEMGVSRFRAAADHSEDNRYQGLYEPKPDQRNGKANGETVLDEIQRTVAEANRLSGGGLL